ncbi:MAG: TadE family protein [Bryobacteraceae bacterium]|nr:TadE family protein [Bryobacteraceae bacterium]
MRNRRNSRRGNALIEFALSFTILFPLLYGTFQFGYSFYLYNRLVNAVRSGARYASVETYQSTTATPTTDFSDRVKNLVVYGDTAGGTTPIVPGLTTANIEVKAVFASNVPVRIVVSIKDYQIRALHNITLNTPVYWFTYMGRYAPA